MDEGGVEVSATTGTHKDGLWRPMSPGSHVVNRLVFRNWTRKMVWHGRVSRFDVETGKWEHQNCPHGHDKQSAARKCGEAAAKRLNKEAQS